LRAVIQRVLKAQVEVQGQQTASMGAGLLVFLAAGQNDSEEQAIWMADKISALRIFPDDAGKMNRSLLDIAGSLIMVSQFTLYGDCRKGNRPSFVQALEPTKARQLCDRFVQRIRDKGIVCGTGVFGADMKVSLTNDGPVTLLLDSSVSRNSGAQGFANP
jgi:D-aminoacyl-tRNA deacylase